MISGEGKGLINILMISGLEENILMISGGRKGLIF